MQASPRRKTAPSAQEQAPPQHDGSAPPPSRRRRRSSAEVTESILAAAGTEFEQAGYDGATTAAIARRAQTTEAQIFRLFGSKRELFQQAVFAPLNRHFAAFHAAHRGELDAAGAPEAVALAYIAELQDFIERHAGMLTSLIVASAYGPAGSADGDQVADLQGLCDYFARGAATMTQRVGEAADVPPELMVRVSFAAVLASVIFRDWLFPPGIAEPEAIRRAIGAFTVHGIAANARQL